MAELEQIARLIPAVWLAPAATGSPARCVAKIREQFALGCDGVILHGASPTDLEPIVREYAKTRPAAGFEHLRANPALS
jgi:alkanesulfonate monooxygenase SsuD/methylene tetrahydromethanopterin reductase-like flavin-dependent oxidoreductase (luciferase family)